MAEHYDHFGGVSPINDQVRALIAALRPELDRHGISLPIYWGNRNWHPLLADTLAEMTGTGIKKALAVVLAAYSSYSSCRQYREDIARARGCRRPRRSPGRQDPGLLQPPRLHRRQCRPCPRSARVDSPPAAATPCRSPSPRTAFRSRWRGTATMSTSFAKRAGLVAGEVGIRPEQLGARLPEPERPAGRSLARARYPRFISRT